MAPKNPISPSVVPMYPPLGLRGTWRTQPRLRQTVGTVFSSSGAQPPPTVLRNSPPTPVSHPPPPPFPANPWRGTDGRRRPGSEARPSGQSIRALFAPTWSPEEP